MKALKILNDACGLLTELEHHSTDDYVNYRLDEVFREAVKLGENTPQTTDIAIRIMEFLIAELGWDKTDQLEEEWYPQKLQDGIHNIINEALGVTTKQLR